MAEVSLETFAGGALALAPSASPNSLQVPRRSPATPTEISLEEFSTGKPADPFSKESLAAENRRETFGQVVRQLKNAGGDAAVLVDMALTAPKFVVGAGAGLGAAARQAVTGDPKLAFTAGREAQMQVMEATFPESPIGLLPHMPLQKIFQMFESGEVYEQSATSQGLQKFMRLLEETGVKVEQATGGRIPRDSVPMMVDTLMVGLIGMGPKQRPGAIDAATAKRLQKEAQGLAAKMREEADAAAIKKDAARLTPEEFSARVPVQEQINEMLAIRTPEEQARLTRARRKEVKQTFERGPSGEPLPPELEGRRTFVDRAESEFVAGEREAQGRAYRETERGIEYPPPEGSAYEIGSSPRPERIGQAEVLRVLQKPGFERTAEDLLVLRRARQEGKASPEAMMLLGAAGIGAAVGGLLDDEALRGAVLGGATGAAAALPFMGRGAMPKGPKGELGAVKGPGGMWHPEAVERLSDILAARLHSNFGSGYRVADVRRADITRPGISKAFIEGKPLVAWSDRAVKNYLNKYAGTEKDPLKDVEIPFRETMKRWGDAIDDAIQGRIYSRVQAPNENFGVRPFTEADAAIGIKPEEPVYNIADKLGELILVRQEHLRSTVGDHLASAAAIKSYLSHVGDYLRQNVPPAKLQQYDLVRAVRETAANDARMAKLAEKASAESTAQLPVHKAYEDGFKWVELKLPEKLTEEQAKGVRPATREEMGLFRGGDEPAGQGFVAVDRSGEPLVNAYTGRKVGGATPEEAWLAGRLAEEGNQMGHCVGGYCEGVATGESRIFSLRDEKGRSHVTVEVEPKTGFSFNRLQQFLEAGIITPEEAARTNADYVSVRQLSREINVPYEELYARVMASRVGPDNISQIKGKQNRAPESRYLPYVQDFVKSDKWGEVRDLEGTGLYPFRQPSGTVYPPEALGRVIPDPASPSGRRIEGGPENLANILPEELSLKPGYYTAEEIMGALRETSARNLDFTPRPWEQGKIDQKLVVGLGTIGLGGLVGSVFTDDPLRGAVLGALATGALHLPGVQKGVAATAAGVDNALGMVSTRIKAASPRLHQRLITYEQKVLEESHRQLNRLVPWMRESTNLPKASRDRLETALFMKTPEVVAEIHKGNPELVAGWREVRNVLNEVGEKAKALGRFKTLLDEYFPQRVKDYEGLKAQLEQPVRARIEQVLKDAEEKALRQRKQGLTEAERDAIINRELRDHYRPQTYRPGYAKPRTIQEVSAELRPFYHTPQESLYITTLETVKDIELARLFGRDLVQRELAGRTYIDLDASIGNILGKELEAGRLTPEKFKEVEQILRARFGPGERSPNKVMQDLQNLGYAGLLADLPSALVQIADTPIAIPAHGLRATIVATARRLSGRAKITAKDMALMDHIAEDLAFGSTQTGPSRLKTRATTAAAGAVGAAAGAILQDDLAGAIPGAAAGMFVGYASMVGTAAALNKTLRQGVFSPIDRFGKDIQLGAAHARAAREVQSAKGVKALERRYGEAFGEEFPALVRDLQTGAMGPQVRSMLFAELSRTQPISKLEAPKLLLEHPNARMAWMLKRFMLKQADFIRREAYDKMKTGDPKKVAQGMKNLTEYVMVLGLAGASTAALQDWLLGREVDFGPTDVMENVLKTFGLSRYVMDKITEGGMGPFQAVGGSLMPPYAIMDRILRADPKAVQYIPIVGQLYYNWELGGKEKAELRRAAEKRKEGERVRLSPEARDYVREQRRKRREERRKERFND